MRHETYLLNIFLILSIIPLLIFRADHTSLKLSSTCFMDVPSLSLIVIYYVPRFFILALLHALSAFFLYRLVSFPTYLLLPSY